MPNGMARSQNFYEGSETVRHPAFKPVQVDPYRRTSTLDNLFPTGNGMGSQDKQRQMMGIRNSSIGQSSETFDKSMWLRQPEPRTSLYNKSFE